VATVLLVLMAEAVAMAFLAEMAVVDNPLLGHLLVVMVALELLAAVVQ